MQQVLPPDPHKLTCIARLSHCSHKQKGNVDAPRRHLQVVPEWSAQFEMLPVLTGAAWSK